MAKRCIECCGVLIHEVNNADLRACKQVNRLWYRAWNRLIMAVLQGRWVCSYPHNCLDQYELRMGKLPFLFPVDAIKRTGAYYEALNAETQ